MQSYEIFPEGQYYAEMIQNNPVPVIVPPESQNYEQFLQDSHDTIVPLAGESVDDVPPPPCPDSAAGGASVDGPVLVPETEEEKEGLKKVLRRYKWCTVCSGGCINSEGYSHRNKRGHAMRALKDHEKEQLTQEWLYKQRGGEQAREAVVRSNRVQQLQQEQQPQSQASPAVPEKRYTLHIGIHKRKGWTVRDAYEKDPHWLAWAMVSTLHVQYPIIEKELRREGLWEQAQALAREKRGMMTEEAKRKRAEVEDKLARGDKVPKDVVKQRRLAAEVLEVDKTDHAEAGKLPHAQKRKGKKRRHVSCATKFNQHCAICGKLGHKSPTCPEAVKAAEDSTRGMVPVNAHQKGKEKALAKVVAHLKYVPPEMRTEQYEERPSKKSRTKKCLSFLDLSRMHGNEQFHHCFDQGLLQDLRGLPCPSSRCAERMQGYSIEPVLGALYCRSSRDSEGKWQCAAFYRCQKCKVRVSWTHGNPMYGIRDNLDISLLCFWNFAHGVSLTTTVLQVGRSEDLVRRYYHTARSICALDAIAREKQVLHGGRFPFTTLVEVDESRFGHWKEKNGEEEVHMHWVWQGVVTRGDMTSLVIWEYGVTKSTGHGPIPPATHDKWKTKCDELFNKDSHVVLFSDGAACYEEEHEGIVEHHAVIHSNHEYTRPEMVTVNVETGQKKSLLVGTQLLDCCWGRLKDDVPPGLAVNTEAGRATKTEYIRAAQWRIIIGTENPWEAFCAAARKWQGGRARDMAHLFPKLSKMSKGLSKAGEKQKAGSTPNVQQDVAGGNDMNEEQNDKEQHEADAQAALECDACGKKGHLEGDPCCPFYGRERLRHVDALVRDGTKINHIRQINAHFTGSGQLAIGGTLYRPGHASGNGYNCLIDSLRQCLNLECNVATVRQHLLTKFPREGASAVTEGNYLVADLHWEETIRGLGQASGKSAEVVPEKYKVIMIEWPNQPRKRSRVHGDVMGSGSHVLYLTNKGNSHFEPLQQV